MADKLIAGSQKRWIGGISNFPKEDSQQQFYFAQSIDYRTDPQALTLLPASIKESGSVVTDLLKWADTTPNDLSVYSYGSMGNLYKRTSAGTWSLLSTIPSSHGNGLAYFYGDDYLYYTADSVIGRYGPVSGSSPQFSNNFLQAAGGVPTNTNSLSLVAASSQYATAADSASLSIISDLSLGCWINPTTLPSAGNTMTLIGKWDESGALRSYRLCITTISGYFGSGVDGALTISVNTTEAPIDSACTGTSGTQTLSATNASFATGQIILIHQTQGTNAGQWERNMIASYTAGTITLSAALANTYTSGAQVRVLKQYTNVTVNSGVTYTAKAWNGTVGGILSFIANGTVTVTGTISANACGFRGGIGRNGGAANTGYAGEGTTGASIISTSANGNGGAAPGDFEQHAAGGGNGTAGGTGTAGAVPGGLAVGSNDLTTMDLGGGGGGVTYAQGSPTAAAGGNGGGIIFISGVTVTVTGSITSTGANGAATGGIAKGASGGGAGGSILLKAQTATLGSSLITASGGSGGTDANGTAGAGGSGRIALDYLTSYTGTTTPTLNAVQDPTLVTTVTYQITLNISNDGTAFDTLSFSANLQTGVWQQVAVSWKASTSTATYFLNATALGTTVGTKTAISDNTSLLYIGANKGASTVGNFYNGLMDEVMVLSTTTDSAFWTAALTQQINTTTAGLQTYYKCNNNLNDATANANNLTNHSTTFSTSVPFSGATTRLDIDQSYTTTGSTYTLPTSIVEDTTDSLTFTPTLDPQASMDFDISAKGTGAWTLTIHDAQNNVIATKTVANASLPSSGWYEFIFSTPWRIVINKTYHAHLTSTVADGSVVSSSLNNFSTGDFHTYYQFLVTDSQFHPITRMLNKIVIGNERYLATWDGAVYEANLIAFPQQTHVRCFGFWRDYLVIGTWSEATSGTPNIYDWATGKIYFWDGISLTFNFWIDIAEGQVNAVYGVDTNLYIMAGYSGQLLLYQGGYIYASGNSVSSKIRKMPYIKPSDLVEVYPSAMTSWRGLVHIGMAANSTSSTLYRGVYSYGTLTPPYPESLSFDYPISTGNTGSTVKIGLVYPAGKQLVIGWQDGSSYGADVIDFTNNPLAATGTIQTLIQDGDNIWHNEEAVKVRADHLTLPAGATVTTKYAINRGSWESAGSITDSTGQFTTTQISDGRGNEYQFAVDMTPGTDGTSPTLLGISTQVNNLSGEEQM